MNVALLQINSVVGDITGNAERIACSVRRAAECGAALCITPELALCGYPPQDLLLRDDVVEACQHMLNVLAIDLKDAPPVLVGAPVANPSPVGKPLHNCAVLLQNGVARVATRKVLLPHYDVFDERRYFESGVGCGVITIDGWRFGVTISEDVWNDKTFWQKHRRHDHDPLVDLMAGGADALINLSASPFSLGKQAVRERMLSRVAQRYRASVIYANMVGANDELIFAGKSMAFNASGTLVARACGFEEDILLVDVAEGRGQIAPDSEHDEEQVWKALVLGTRDYVRKCGFTDVVLGLSGGIDSALVAAIACEALGAEHVLGVLLPSPHSSEGSITDALQLATNLGMQTHTVPIAPLMQAFDTVLEPFFAGCPCDVTEENLQSRIRGDILMAFSNKFNKLLLATGNKSEISVGYCTIYGDMAGALGIIADVSKTMVYRVCRWLNTSCGGEVIPEEIIIKAPSAELRPDQKDSDSLPDYDVLDAILVRLVEQHQSVASIVAEGFDAATVQRVERLVACSEFKRKQAAPGLRITECAFGSGWRRGVAGKVSLPS